MLTYVQILGIYNKGVAIKEINQAGRTLTDNVIRQGSSGSTSKIHINPTLSGDPGPRCLIMGNTTYLWSYASDTSATTTAYKKTDGEPVNFVRTTGLSSCPGTGATLNSTTTKYSPLLNDALRVYTANITKDTNLAIVNVKFSFGTFAGVGAGNNPVVTGTAPNQTLSCSSNPAIGNYCAFGNYATSVYLPNPLVGP
ncbi:MAG: hypothetical protein ABIS24_02605 [Candidatus Saccharimonadales bacterium]